MQDILIPTLRYILYRLKKDTPLLVESVSADKEGQIIEAVETLCDWSAWSTDDQDHLRAMRSNTIKNVADSFKEYKDQTLIEEVLG